MPPETLYGVGALLLVTAFLWAMLCFSKSSRSENAASDRAARH
jgi:hypothetical protein